MQKIKLIEVKNNIFQHNSIINKNLKFGRIPLINKNRIIMEKLPKRKTKL
jgi:hypothetical protein